MTHPRFTHVLSYNPGRATVAREYKNPANPSRKAWIDGVSLGGSYRDRTDDIHGVNVALYQLS